MWLASVSLRVGLLLTTAHMCHDVAGATVVDPVAMHVASSCCPLELNLGKPFVLRNQQAVELLLQLSPPLRGFC